MASHHQMNDIPLRSLDALGLPHVLMEPEVVRSTLSRVRAKTLARIIAELLTENEPLLSAEHDGASVAVTDPDGNVMRFTITEGVE